MHGYQFIAFLLMVGIACWAWIDYHRGHDAHLVAVDDEAATQPVPVRSVRECRADEAVFDGQALGVFAEWADPRHHPQPQTPAEASNVYASVSRDRARWGDVA